MVNIQVFWTALTLYTFYHVPQSQIRTHMHSSTKMQWELFTTEKLLPWTKIPHTCLTYPVLGQWLMFSQSPYLSFRLFTQFCAYIIFWPVIVKYSNINLNMPPKNILYNVVLLAHLSTLHFYLSSSCVPICVIFRWLTYLSLIHIWRCRRIERCRSRWSPYH